MPHPLRHQAHQGAGPGTRCPGRRARGSGFGLREGQCIRSRERSGARRGKDRVAKRVFASLRENLQEGAGDKGRGENTLFRVFSAATLAAELRWLGLAPLPPSLMQLPAPTCHENFCYSPLADVLVYHV